MSEPIRQAFDPMAGRPGSANDALIEQIGELSAISGGLAHEIRNPLSTLKVNLQLLDEDWRTVQMPDGRHPADPKDVARRSRLRLASLLSEADRLSRILDDFLQYVRQPELDAAPGDVTEIIAELADFYRPEAESHGIEFRIVADGGPHLCEIDSTLFKAALLNLLINAQQAMTGGGRLTVRVGPGSGGTVQVNVVDSGPGISPQIALRIFDAYFSTKKGGCGLGLAQSRQIIRRHGGTIGVSPADGGGADFEIRLPLLPAEADAPIRGLPRSSRLIREDSPVPNAPVPTGIGENDPDRLTLNNSAAK